MTRQVFADRVRRVRAEMAAQGVDVLLLSVGPDLPYLTGYEAMPLERLTMLVLPRQGEATLVVPAARGAAGRRAARRVRHPAVGGDRRSGRARGRAGRRARRSAAIGDHTWARFLVDLMGAMPATTFRRANGVVGTAPDAQGRGRDRRPAGRRRRPPTASPPSCRAGEIALVGRTEADVSADLSRRLLAEGHDNGELRHRRQRPQRGQPPPRRQRAGHPAGRRRALRLRRHGWPATAATSPAASRSGEPPAEVAEAYAVLQEAQQAAVAPRSWARRARRSTPSPGASSPPAGTATGSSTAPGTASGWRSTRTRTSSRATPCRSRPATPSASSPGIYTPGRWGMRLEDIVVATARRPRAPQPREPRPGRPRRLRILTTIEPLYDRFAARNGERRSGRG